MNVPSRLDVVAATMAPAMLPWAIEVKLIDDCTVEGTRHNHMTPVWRAGVSAQGTRTLSARPMRGKAMKVNAMMSPCIRQFFRPSRVSEGCRRAP